jgi:transglutaminase-like putative cysteine protease
MGNKLLLWILLAVFFISVQDVGYMGDTRPIIVFIGIVLFVSYLPRAAWRVIALILTMLILLKWQFYAAIPWTHLVEFVVALVNDLRVSVMALIHGQFRQLSRSIRTLVFYGVVVYGTWFMEDSLERPWWFFFILFSGEWILYLESLLYKAKLGWALAEFMVVGLVLLAYAHAQRMVGGKMQGRWREWVRQFLWPALLSLVIVAFSMLVPWVKTNTNQVPSAPTAPTASHYNAHNNNLGGPFVGTTKVLLKVFANSPSYYRGEVLNTYTGTGWQSGLASTVPLSSGHTIPASILYQAGLTYPQKFALYTMRVQVVHGSYPVMFTGYLPEKVTVITGSKQLRVNSNTAQISGPPLLPGDEYVSSYRAPQMSTRLFLGIQDGNQGYAFAHDLQLPASLPSRDVQLARSITANQPSTYGKVEALIRYLDTHERYQTSNIPYLKPGQDFVDQFLFVTHRGYCDHFSSSLAVLARAVGIPSRWVRGFISVPPSATYQGPGDEFLLRGVDAHSWVEIWMAGVGWVPFEATPSFSLPQPQSKSVGTEVPKVKPQQPQPVISIPFATRMSGKVAVLITVISLLGMLVVAWLITLRMLQKRKRKKPEDVAISRLLLQFLRLIGGRKAHETLRETAQRIGASSGGHDMIEFIEWYERFRYGGHGVSLKFGEKLLAGLRARLRKRHRDSE